MQNQGVALDFRGNDIDFDDDFVKKPSLPPIQGNQKAHFLHNIPPPAATSIFIGDNEKQMHETIDLDDSIKPPQKHKRQRSRQIVEQRVREE